MAINVQNETITKVLGPVTAYAVAVAEGYQGTQAEWEAEIANASNNAATATEQALVAEGYATGKQNGVDVTSESPYFENNAKHYMELTQAAGLTNDIRNALLQCFSHVMWDDAHGQDYYDDLEEALYPEKQLARIVASYDSEHEASITDTLDSLKPYLTVIAYYQDGTTETVTDYTLSGTLSVGENTITVRYKDKTTTFTVIATADSNAVDVCLFAGQSNMDGRGTAADAPTVEQGTALLWDSSNHRVTDFVAEGSLIPAFVKEYYEEEHVPIVEVKEAVGGTSISQYISVNLANAKAKLEECLEYLENDGKTVRRCFMLWNQGENDVSDGTTASTYETLFAQLKAGVEASGVEKIFVINIGQASSGNYDFTTIRGALEDVCDAADVAMVSDKFYNSLDYMKDQWHYTQIVYNTVGKDAAKNTVAVFNESATVIKAFDASDVFGIPDVYGTLDNWAYITRSTKVVLTGYTGNNPSVHVYHLYLHNGLYYEARLAKQISAMPSVFNGNTVITDITIDDGVICINPTNYNEADNQQGLSSFFRGMTALTSVTWGNTPAAFTAADYVFSGASNDILFNFISRISGSFRDAFSNTKIVHGGNISNVTRMDNMFYGDTELLDVGTIGGTYSDASGAFRSCSKLKSVGVFSSTALTNIGSMFYGCSSLEGIIRFESASISNATGTFNNVDMTKIEVQVPANSTSYTTITTAWPNANVTTF